jgi:hypothetical protein
VNIPAPEWSISPARQLIAGIIFAAVLIAALVYAVRAARQVRQPYPVYIMLAAGLIVFGEPFVDVLGHCAFPEIGATPWVHVFGRVVGTYMAPVYFFYFGTGILITMRMIAAGVTTRRWWQWYAGAVAFALAFEPLPIRNGWWTYYGPNQPLKFFGLPIWWAFANTGGWLVAGAIMHVLISRRVLAGVGTLAIFPLMPVIFMGSHTMMAFPIYVALNSSDSTLVTNAVQLATIALSLAAVWASGRLVSSDGISPEIRTSAPARPETAAAAS